MANLISNTVTTVDDLRGAGARQIEADVWALDIATARERLCSGLLLGIDEDTSCTIDDYSSETIAAGYPEPSDVLVAVDRDSALVVDWTR